MQNQTNCGVCGKSMKLSTNVAIFELNKSGYGTTQNSSKWQRNSRWWPEGLNMQLNWCKIAYFCDDSMKFGTHIVFLSPINLYTDPRKIQNGGEIQDVDLKA